MKGDRLLKLNKELQKAFGNFIERESNKESLITVTRCDISPDLKNVTVFISVFPEDKEHSVLSFLTRRKWDARDYIKSKITTRVIPFVDFQIDYGDKNRRHIDALLKADTIQKDETQ